MKIAMPVENGQVNPHFGTSREFAVLELKEGKVVDKKIISAEGLQHNHGGLAGLIRNEQVDVVITGGIGGHMLEALQQMGLKVVPGAAGEITAVAEAYAAGTLATRPNVCGCGGHGHGHGSC
ncbi:putative Fe-Mo cluster-binding NifX family protein [Desulfohalotomaculum tongense]|uniref:NifB/NifX family molybdenum-iron cluster-binding protein n=1 Tax=Desulforadius tongensis TaxID=1216062 RepID=UPI00195C396C|nr:NifB/NifX family molybdenum-iron cluster-binding protein [Desulforadius tongensis]MBM7853961.1 putative Fe-Mo cluster-binding NifX family protein [Desulforadius tongensis]